MLSSLENNHVKLAIFVATALLENHINKTINKNIKIKIIKTYIRNINNQNMKYINIHLLRIEI
jgi:hypothetical protein